MGKYRLAFKALKVATKTVKNNQGFISGVTRVAKNTAIGGTAGFLAGKAVSDSVGAPAGQRSGARIGAIAGFATGLPAGKIARGTYEGAKVVARGLKATPGSSAGAAIHSAERAGRTASVIFRRIRGRLVAIKRKL